MFSIVGTMYFLGPLGLEGTLHNTIYKCTFWALWVKKERVIIPLYRCTFWVLWAQREPCAYIIICKYKHTHIYILYIYTYHGCGNPASTKGCGWRNTKTMRHGLLMDVLIQIDNLPKGPPQSVSSMSKV